MRKFFSILCILLGLTAIVIGVNLLGSNQSREEKAGEFVEAVLPQLEQHTIQREAAPDTTEEIQPGESYILLDGLAYLGTLEFPSLGLTLPVLAEYNDSNIELAPCRYSGTQAEGNMVIAGHNYAKHFHYVSGLEAGAQILFTDAAGAVSQYQVLRREILDGTAVEEMAAGDWDMTLFTCTYGGKGRVALRCGYISE